MGFKQSSDRRDGAGFIQIRRCVVSAANPSCSLRTTCDPEIVIDRVQLKRSLNALESFSGE